jgi:hypothetical protein
MSLLKFQPKHAARELHEILTVKRPHGSASEHKFIKRYIDTLPGVTADGYGNRRVVVGGAKAPAIMWSCHTDTVHNSHGTQTIIRDGDMIRLHGKERANCLGADDGTGVWLMRQMIMRGIPGHYVFHRGEECGGLGSSWIASHDIQFLTQFQCAIALDRKGYSSVITHQGSRCASDLFAQSLADQLPTSFKPDATGVFTDTANYIDFIPECTNLSVGYGAQHCKNEAQNVPFAMKLLEALCDLNPRDLSIVRDPKEIDIGYWGTRYTDYYKDDWYGSEFWDEVKARGSSNYDKLFDIVKDNPSVIADYLDHMGVDADLFEEHLGIYDN